MLLSVWDNRSLSSTLLSLKPEFLSSESLNLLKGLLTRDSSKRLGGGANGSDAVKRHPFFKSINWPRLESRQIESKFKPNVSCHMDVGECVGKEGCG